MNIISSQGQAIEKYEQERLERIDRMMDNLYDLEVARQKLIQTIITGLDDDEKVIYKEMYADLLKVQFETRMLIVNSKMATAKSLYNTFCYKLLIEKQTPKLNDFMSKDEISSMFRFKL